MAGYSSIPILRMIDSFDLNFQWNIDRLAVRTMRAAIIGNANLDYAGGAERSVKQMAQILSDNGYSVTIFSVDYMKHDIDKSVVKPFYEEINAFSFDIFSNKKLIKVSNGISMGFIGLISFWKIWEIIDGYDLYYFPYPSILLGNFLKYSYRLGKRPQIIIANHGTYFEILESKKVIKKLLRDKLTRMIFGYVGKLNVKVQTQNSYQYNFYRYVIGIEPESLYLIPQCEVDFNMYSVGRNDTFRVVFLNKLTKNKGSKLLFRLLREAKDIQFDIIGYYDHLDKLKKEFKDSTNVVFHGYVSEDKKIKILEGADIMINLSIYESLSISSIEGLASGLTVVGPKISGIQYISDRVPQGVILSEMNVNSIIGWLRRMKELKESNPTKFFILKTKIREDARRVFSRESISEMMEKMVFGERETDRIEPIFQDERHPRLVSVNDPRNVAQIKK